MQCFDFFSNLSIRLKLFILVIGLTFISTGIFTVVASRTTYFEINAHVNRSVKSTYQNIKTFLCLTAQHVDQVSMSILSNDDIQNAVRDVNRGQTTADQREIYSRLVENEFLKITLGRDEIRAIFLLSNDGFKFSMVVDPKINLSTISDGELAKINAAKGTPVWLKTDVLSKTIPLGRVFIDTATQQPSGILLLFFEEQYFANLFQALKVQYSGDLFLLSDDGFVISHSDKKLLGTQFKTPYIDKILAKTEDSFFQYAVEGQDSRIWSFAMPDYNWRLISIMPDAIINAPIKALQRRMLIIGLFCWLGAALIGLMISRGISKPVDQLLNSIRGFSRGGTPQKVPWKSKDEIGLVVDAYNQLLEHLKKTESEKANLQFQLQQSQKMESIGTLVGGIAHDFNNILAAILGYAEITLYRTEANTVCLKNVVQIQKAGLRAKELIKQLLNFSRPSSSQFEPISLAPVVLDAITLMKATLSSSISIRSDLLDKDLLVKGDVTQIHQILINLMTNAFHALSAQGGSIDVQVSAMAVTTGSHLQSYGLKPGQYATISVQDNGSGMGEATLGRIFDPFFTTKPKEKGTGLGLSVVHGLVTNHGGKIHVESKLKKGTTFKIFLPCHEHETQDIEPVDTQTVVTGRGTILFVDDEEDLVEIAREMLSQLGFTVITYTSSVEALNAFESQPESFDLLITDMEMPVIKGNELALAIHTITPDLPIILCSGFSEKMSSENMKEFGIYQFLMKPFSLLDISRSVNNCLSIRS